MENCVDEGCPHYGAEHECVTRVETRNEFIRRTQDENEYEEYRYGDVFFPLTVSIFDCEETLYDSDLDLQDCLIAMIDLPSPPAYWPTVVVDYTPVISSFYLS